MDIPFLNLICESFLVQHDCFKTNPKEIQQIKETIITDLTTLVRELRETDIELYDKLYDSSRVDQTKILTNYLNVRYLDNETINEIGIFLPSMIAGMLILTLTTLGKPISNTIFYTASTIGTWIESLGKYINTKGKNMQFRFQIIQRNHEKCYTKCEVKKEDIEFFNYLAVKKQDYHMMPALSSKQSACLRECFVELTIEQINLLMNNYFACLRYSKAYTDVENAKPDEILKIISGVQASPACLEIYKIVKESFDNFYKLLEFLYEDYDNTKQEKLMLLKDRILQTRNAISKYPMDKIASEGGFQKQPFQKSSYQKPQQR